MTDLRLIVGLGNPGPQYQDTRHNAGFWFIDRLADDRRVPLAPQARFFGVAGRTGEIWLLKPMLYMNRSGQAVAALARFYKITVDEILVAHDELDLEPGVVRLKQGGGNAGHNGLKDITAALGSPDFWRLRIGIGHPRARSPQQEVVNFVLNRPNNEEVQAIDQAIDRCIGAQDRLLAGDYEAAMRALHTVNSPDRNRA